MTPYHDPLGGESSLDLLDELSNLAAHAPHNGDRSRSNERRRNLFRSLAARLCSPKKDANG